MQTFKVFLKGKGEPFELKCERFEFKDEVGFVLYDSNNRASQDGFLSPFDIAAIIPESQPLDSL